MVESETKKPVRKTKPKVIDEIKEVVEENKKIPSNNILEKSLREASISVNSGDPAMMELAIAMREKNAIVERFLSSDELKTQVNKTERQCVPLIYLLAEEPFYSTREFYAKYKNMDDYEEIRKEQTINELVVWANQFLVLGLALDRMGRKEDKDAISSLFSQDMNIRNGGQNGQIPKV
jgi:hypothetical protein